MDASRPFIVALYSDAPRAGKSTSARRLEALAHTEGLAVDILSFAHPLRRAARHVLPPSWTEEQVRAHLSGHLKDRPIPELNGKTGRDILKVIGNSARREFGDDVWAKRLFEEIAMVGYGGIVIIDDLRRDCEYDLIKRYPNFALRLVTARPPMHETDSTEGLLWGYPFDGEVPAKGLVEQAVLEQIIGDVWEQQILPRINGV